jgi:hypothetical protein
MAAQLLKIPADAVKLGPPNRFTLFVRHRLRSRRIAVLVRAGHLLTLPVPPHDARPQQALFPE